MYVSTSLPERGGTALPKVDIPIGGYGQIPGGYNQVPDERTGPPRITRLVNCVADNGVIRKTPGTATISRTASRGYDLNKVATFGITPSGTAFCLSKQRDISQDNIGLEAFAARDTASSTEWEETSTTTRTYIEYDEAPRAIPVFTAANVHFEAGGVMDTSTNAGTSKEFVVVAQGLHDYVGAGISFGLPYIYWAHFPPGSLTPKSNGRVNAHGTPNSRPYLVVAGPYCAAYTGYNTISVFYFDHAADNLAVGTSVTAVGCEVRRNIDMAWDPVARRILLVDADGSYWLIDPDNSFAVTRSGSFGLTMLTQGTIGIATASSVAYTGRTYIVYRSGGDWKLVVRQIHDAADNLVSGPHTLLASGSITDPAPFRRQPSVTAIEDAPVSVNPDFAAVCVWQNRTSGDTDSGFVLGVTPAGAATMLSNSFDMFSAAPASKPMLHTYPYGTTPRVYSSIWGYQGSQRTLRNAIRLKASDATFTDGGVGRAYPRMVSSVFRGGNSPPTPTEYLVGHVNPSLETALPPIEGESYRSGWITAIQRQKNAFDDACDVYLVAQGDGTKLFSSAANPPDILQSASVRDNTLFATALPSMLTTRLETAGAQYVPRRVGVATAGVGTNPVAGVYQYVSVREWRDANGNLHRSPPSDPVELDHTGGNVTVSLYDDPWLPRHLETKTKIYRTKAGGTVYYLINSVIGSASPGASHDPVTWTDQSTDDQIGSREILYTQGGTLETWGAPGCRCLWSGVDRAIAGGLEDERRIRWSNLYFPGEGISWPEHPAFFADLPEPIVAVACLDGIWLAFSQANVWAITGQGPDAQGQGYFDTPRLIGSVGAYSWRSLVEAPPGLYFQAPDRQIYLIVRGSLQVLPASTAIRDSIGQEPENHATLSSARNTRVWDLTSNWIRGALYDSYKREVWFGEYKSRHWVLNLDSNTWRSEVDTQTTYRYLLGAGLTKVLTTNYYTTTTITVPAWIRTDNTGSVGSNEIYRSKRTSEPGTYTDSGGNTRRMAFFTSDIDLTHGRIRRITINLAIEGIFSSMPKADLAFWFDGYSGALSPELVSGVAHIVSGPDAQRFANLEFAPARQKCNEFRFAYIDNPEAAYANISWHVVSVSMEIEGLSVRKLQRLTSSRGN